MAHKLDGDWHSYVVFRTGTSSVLADDDLIKGIKVNVETGRIEAGKHTGKDISGSVIPVGSSFAVSIEHEIVGSATHNFRYEGALVNEDSTNGISVITGTRRKVLRPPPLNREQESPSVKEVEADLTSQNDGTWVGTQP